MLKSPQSIALDLSNRASRKVHWMLLKIAQSLYNWRYDAFSNLPYVKHLNSRLSINRVHELSDYYRFLGAEVAQLPLQPKISVLIPVYKSPLNFLEECLTSITKQIYNNWEICLVDDCSNDKKLTELIKRYVDAYPNKIKLAVNPKNSHISVTSNHCLALATGEYIALLDHDDRLYPNSLAENVRFINLEHEPDILYSDERTITHEGEKYLEPFRKPGWSPWMHLCMNYTTHLSVYKADLIRKIGGFRAGFEGSQDHDLMLRAIENTKKPVVHVPFCLYQWRAHPQSTALSVGTKPYAAIAGEKAVSEALIRRGRFGSVHYESDTHHYRLNFPVARPLPKVSIIVFNLEGSDCALQKLIENTSYQNYEIIALSAQSWPTPNALPSHVTFKNATYEKLLPQGKKLNMTVALAEGDYLIFLSGKAIAFERDWVQELLSLGQFPEVGAVCGQINTSNGVFMSAGQRLNVRQGAEYLGSTLNLRHSLYCNILHTIHESGAVDLRFFAVKRQEFADIGGFVEEKVQERIIDVDLSLRIRKKGLSILYTPYSRITLSQHKKNDHVPAYFERLLIRKKYPEIIMSDPTVNPNLAPSALFHLDPIFERLDLSAKEFEYFLTTPMEQWGEIDLKDENLAP